MLPHNGHSELPPRRSATKRNVVGWLIRVAAAIRLPRVLKASDALTPSAMPSTADRQTRSRGRFKSWRGTSGLEFTRNQRPTAFRPVLKLAQISQGLTALHHSWQNSAVVEAPKHYRSKSPTN